MYPFAKYVAAGNDFIVCETLPKEIALWCDRRYGIGADGLIWVEGDYVHFYNCDGVEVSACGNGLRVAAVHTQEQRLRTALGVHEIHWTPTGCRISYPDPRAFHEVIEVEDPTTIFHPPQSLNKNYVCVLDRAHVRIKTIERGVGETPSCGTGAISTLLTLLEQGRVDSKIIAEFTSNERLEVEKIGETIWLEGPVKRLFCGSFG